MHYRNYDLYKAFKLKLNYLKNKLSGQYDHALEKLGMFAEETMAWQQVRINTLESEKEELVSLIMSSNAAVHYMTLRVAKEVAKNAR